MNTALPLEEVRLKTYRLKVQTINCERLRHRVQTIIVNACATVEERRFQRRVRGKPL